MKDVILESENIILRPMVASDVAEIFEVGCDERIWPYLSMKMEKIEDAKLLVANAMKEKEAGIEYPFVIINKSDQRMVGSTRFLEVSLQHRSREIGWTFLHPSVWRSSVNTEAKYLLLKYCFEELNCIRVQFKTDERNVRSQTAIERIGATKEGVLRKHRVTKDGYLRNSLIFSIVEEEWIEVKIRLEEKLCVYKA